MKKIIYSLFITVAALFFTFGLKKTNLPILGHIQEFEFTNSNSTVFSSNRLKGKVWLFNLFFTSCAGPCPLITSNLKTVYQDYVSKENFEMVSLSVDPERDKPEQLLEYAKRFNVNPEKWFFIVGPEEKMRNVAVNSFQLGTPDQPTLHSTRVVLVDAEGNIRGFYMGIVPDDIAKLKKDLSRLL